MLEFLQSLHSIKCIQKIYPRRKASLFIQKGFVKVKINIFGRGKTEYVGHIDMF